MNTEQAEKGSSLMARLYPGKVSRELGKVIARSLLPFDPKMAKRAIEEHARKFEFPNLPALIESLQTVDRDGRAAAKAAPQKLPDETWCQVMRRTHPWVNRMVHRDGVPCDVEVVIRLHRQWWRLSSQSDGYRRKFESDCFNILVSLGTTEAAARDYVAAVFGEDVNFFSLVLDELRDDIPSGKPEFAHS